MRHDQVAPRRNSHNVKSRVYMSLCPRGSHGLAFSGAQALSGRNFIPARRLGATGSSCFFYFRAPRFFYAYHYYITITILVIVVIIVLLLYRYQTIAILLIYPYPISMYYKTPIIPPFYYHYTSAILR